MIEYIKSLPIWYLAAFIAEAAAALILIIAIICIAAKTPRRKKGYAQGGDAVYDGEPLPENARRVVLDEDAKVIVGARTATIEEAYSELSEEQKSFYDRLKEYATAKEDTTVVTSTSYENVKIGKKSILKLLIKRDMTVASFLLENEMVKDYRRSGKGEKNAIRIRPTEVIIYDETAFETAIDMIEMSLKQIERDRALAIERRKLRRRQRAKEAAAAENAELSDSNAEVSLDNVEPIDAISPDVIDINMH